MHDFLSMAESGLILRISICFEAKLEIVLNL